MRLRILTNLPSLAQAGHIGVQLEIVNYRRPHGIRGHAAALARLYDCDYVVINCAARDLLIYCLLKAAAPFSAAKIVSLDTVLPVPRPAGVRQRLSLAVKKLLFRQVHLFIEYFRDTAGYERHYGMPRSRFRYIPFKVNRLHRILRTATSDGGYIFCGGNTRRDFQTLIAAVRGLPYPVRIVTMSDAVIAGHGSALNEGELPLNVEVVRHDGSETFVDHMASARLAVLPIKRDNISASGIGVYLASMALGKCVITSEGPAVDGVVPPGAAVIVPPERPAELRDAIVHAWTDAAFRERTAAAGRAYALSLGGEERLGQSVLDVLMADAMPVAARLAVTQPS
jgi:glycosyltransferase involved in cell wall biosynthesis